jgi:hypothetical protein
MLPTPVFSPNHVCNSQNGSEPSHTVFIHGLRLCYNTAVPGICMENSRDKRYTSTSCSKAFQYLEQDGFRCIALSSHLSGLCIVSTSWFCSNDVTLDCRARRCIWKYTSAGLSSAHDETKNFKQTG